MVYEKEAMIMAGGGAVGVAQTFILSKFVDGRFVVPIPMVPAGFTKPSAFLGTVLGAGGVIVGYQAMKTGKYIPDPRLQYAVLAYGGAALATGLISGMTGGMVAPATGTARMRAVSNAYAQRALLKEENIL